MAVTRIADRGRHSAAGPGTSRARAGAGLGLVKRFLTLREGSIIVVTLIAFVYFATTTNFSSPATSRRCCRTSPRSRSWRPARCS